MRKIKQTVRTILLCGFLFAYTDATLAQITLSVKQQPVREVIKEIERISDYRFFYNENSIPMEKRVTVNVKDSDIENVLNLIADQMGISYVIKNNQIALSAEKRANVAQQTRKVQGTVVDDLGMPVIGANVSVKGTTNGTITDMDGNFLLEVPNNAILEITYIGYRPQEIAIKGQTRVDIKLAEDTQKLDEVVVVGYGTQKKATLTGAVASLKGEELAKVSQPNMKANLIGKIPGVRYQESTGEPGVDSSDRFNIRGFGEPLVIVDGVERPFTQIDPNEIASMNVLKDASAAVYGFKGVNGVIIIETKKGEMSRPKINYSYSIGLQSPVKNLEMMNAYEYAYYRNQALMNAGQSKRFTDEEVEKYRTGSDPINYPSTDWYAETVRKVAPKQQHNLNINGGSEKIRYFFSLG